jgi:ubiquinone/menaquinone biosynthesis C-methylase UbiE
MRHKNLRSVSRVRRDYDQAIDNYDRIRFGTPGGQYVHKKEQEFVASVIKDSGVLEVGTATGRFAVALTSRGLEYTGVDLSQMMLRETRDRTNQSFSLIQMDDANWVSKLLQLCSMHTHLPLPIKTSRGFKRNVRRITAIWQMHRYFRD